MWVDETEAGGEVDLRLIRDLRELVSDGAGLDEFWFAFKARGLTTLWPLMYICCARRRTRFTHSPRGSQPNDDDVSAAFA
eukprot:1187786-Prorocentrum_minimum.AAC.2